MDIEQISPPRLLVKPAAKLIVFYDCSKRITVPARKKTEPPIKKPKRANLFISILSSVEKSLPSLRMIDSTFSSADSDTKNAAMRQSSPLLNISQMQVLQTYKILPRTAMKHRGSFQLGTGFTAISKISATTMQIAENLNKK